MFRFAFLASFAIMACGPGAATVDPPEEPSRRSLPVATHRSTPDRSAPPLPSCSPGAVAPPDAPACAADLVCDADADCADDPGNYCEASACAVEGCYRGRCSLTKVQGEDCSRDGECVSGSCVCTSEGCVCAPQNGDADWHGP